MASLTCQSLMLKRLPPLISPDLLHTLASMGHGDELALVDAHFPASRVAQQGQNRLIRLPGINVDYANVMLRKGLVCHD
jgi:L-fucose mutarotase